MANPKAAARHLVDAHRRRERFAPLPAELAPSTTEEAYAIQDGFVARRAEELGAIAGYKIALSSAEMQRYVGVNQPQAGVMLQSTLRQTPARVRAADYVHLIVEFEIAVRVAADLPAADAPYSRAQVAECVGAVMPAIEIADDRNADYSQLARHPLELIADNGWNEGAVLGVPLEDWRSLDLAAVRGVATINGREVGEGVGAAALGHPLDAVVWIANHLAAHGRGLVFRDVVITGSITTTKSVQPGDLVRFEVDRLGSVELRVD
ncbi:MAG TPA: fumarylacetoacetate hydrolase family protein [Burkholderiales bacterium]|nr:fumarylacetoacetate hydrolase family protein [Burkholderiales bacterium]